MQPVTLDDIRRRIADAHVDAVHVREVASGVTEVRIVCAGIDPVMALHVEPSIPATAAALVVHPATGDRTSLLGDAHMLASAGVRCLLPELPTGRGESAADLVGARVASIEALCCALIWLRRESGARSIGFLGKNLGGALGGAVCAIDGHVAAAVAVAPLPDIGRFFTESMHPVARARRDRDGGAVHVAVRDSTEQLELRVTIGASSATRWLLQLGADDDWADVVDASAELNAAAPSAEIEVVPGADHDVASEEARVRRVAWLGHQLRLDRSP